MRGIQGMEEFSSAWREKRRARELEEEEVLGGRRILEALQNTAVCPSLLSFNSSSSCRLSTDVLSGSFTRRSDRVQIRTSPSGTKHRMLSFVNRVLSEVSAPRDNCDPAPELLTAH